VSSAINQWEIAERGFGDGWYRIGKCEASKPRSALESWLEGRIRRPGVYGVRSSREAAWQPFRLDASGALHEHRVNETAEGHRVDELEGHRAAH
jgi:hypothetical protein